MKKDTVHEITWYKRKGISLHFTLAQYSLDRLVFAMNAIGTQSIYI